MGRLRRKPKDDTIRIVREYVGPRNTLHLIHLKPTMSGPRHGGARMQRHACLYINGICHENYTEGNEFIGWATGKFYDEFLERQVKRYEKVLGCKVIRGRMLK